MKNQLCRVVVVTSLAAMLAGLVRAEDPPAKGGKATNRAPQFTPPPAADEPAAIKDSIDKAAAALRAGKTPSDILSDPAYLAAHEWTRFRKLIRENASGSQATLVTSGEPGDPLVVAARVVDENGKPVPGVVVYAYHTSSKGWYSDRAAHVQSNGGDSNHARLFGYVTTDRDGKFGLRTIRPGSYPNSGLPRHIHLEMTPPGAEKATVVTEIVFDDDPFLKGRAREESKRAGFAIAAVRRDERNARHVDVEFKLAR